MLGRDVGVDVEPNEAVGVVTFNLFARLLAPVFPRSPTRLFFASSVSVIPAVPLRPVNVLAGDAPGVVLAAVVPDPPLPPSSAVVGVARFALSGIEYIHAVLVNTFNERKRLNKNHKSYFARC